jgi:hypothetical protein
VAGLGEKPRHAPKAEGAGISRAARRMSVF